MKFPFKKPRPHTEVFSIQHTEDLDLVATPQDDVFFDEAFSEHSGSALKPARAFMGPIIPKMRYQSGIILFALALFVLLFKTGHLQLVQGAQLRSLAENNRFRERIIPALRGIIYDRNGNILAKNDPAFNIIANKSLFDDQAETDQQITALAALLEVPSKIIFDQMKQARASDEQILLIEDLPYEKAMLFQSLEHDFPEISLEIGSTRSYVTNEIPSLSHIIGFTGMISQEEFAKKATEGYRRFDRLGKQGLEAFYETVMRGEYGHELIEVDARGRLKRIVSKRDPVDGENIYTSLNTELQKYIEEVLKARMAGTAASRGSVVVMDPNNGEILALVSWPAYDANLFSQGIDSATYNELLNNDDKPLFPRATAGEFPSGSTIKPVFASAALIEGIITPTTSFLSTGGITVGPWFFPDWRPGGHGVTNVYHAIADSVNTFFYLIGGGNENVKGLGLERLMKYAALFGFGEKTGIDIPGEADGFLPSKEWKEATKGEVWYIGDTYHVAIGQGDLLVTPLQIARSTAVFASGGYLVTPKININAETSSTKIIDDGTVRVIRDAMRETVLNGSARSLQAAAVPVAGKTGTAQWSTSAPNHSWFTGFAPFDKPEIVVTVLIEEGADDNLAIPVSRDIINWYFTQ